VTHPIVAAASAIGALDAVVDEATAQHDQELLQQVQDQALVDGYRQATDFLDRLQNLGVNTNHILKARSGLDSGFAQAVRITARQA
jgi:hypothetical protein